MCQKFWHSVYSTGFSRTRQVQVLLRPGPYQRRSRKVAGTQTDAYAGEWAAPHPFDTTSWAWYIERR